MGNSDVFTIHAQRCKRCGGLLTSSQGLRDGYGHSCKMKVAVEEANRRMMKDQITLFPQEEKTDG